MGRNPATWTFKTLEGNLRSLFSVRNLILTELEDDAFKAVLKLIIGM